VVAWNRKYVDATHFLVRDGGAVPTPFRVTPPLTVDFTTTCAAPRIYVAGKWHSPTQELLDASLRTQGHTFVRCGAALNQTFLLVAPPVAPPLPKAWDAAALADVGADQVRDIVVLLFDALSREKFRAAFPRSYAVLARMDDGADGAATHEAFRFERHTIRGSNSPPNKLALFAGLRTNVTAADKAGFRWLWRRAEKAGFATMHAEGECGGKHTEIVSTTKRIKNRKFFSSAVGWSRGTLSHWTLVTESRLPAVVNFPSAALCDAEMMGKETCNITPRRARYRNGFNYQQLCVGHAPVYRHLLEYVQSFLDLNMARRRFSTTILVETHEELAAYPTLDAELSDILSAWTTRDASMRNAAIVLMSDHGIHFGTEYRTKAGFIHHKLPLATMLLPKPYLTAHPEQRVALRGNTHALTTHLDMYRTLSELISGGKASLDAEFASNDPRFTLNAQSLSLLSRLPNRTCEEAGVKHHFCPCGMYCLEYKKRKQLPRHVWAAFTDFSSQIFAAAGTSAVCTSLATLPFKLAGTCKATATVMYRIVLDTPVFEAELFLNTAKNDTSIAVTSTFAERAAACDAKKAFRKAVMNARRHDDVLFRKVQELCICS
jgi:hypothetical protein